MPSFVAAVAAGDPATAARTIFAENILGGTCSRVCPVEVLCQRDCVLVHEGRPPIEIGALQRYATDWAFENGTRCAAACPPTAGASRSSAPALPGWLRLASSPHAATR